MRTVLWKRLDQEGHDACRFTEARDGWTIEGAAVFEHDGNPANLAYRLSCDRQWSTLKASVTGWIGETGLDLRMERGRDGSWSVNGTVVEALAGLKDIDLGFTPASNTNAIRRLNLTAGDEAASTAAWLDTEDWTMKPLPQTYRRLRDDAYAYASPQHDYRATLLVDDFGIIIDYPGLWKSITNTSDPFP